MKKKMTLSLDDEVLRPLREAGPFGISLSELVDQAIRHALIHGFIRDHGDGLKSITITVSEHIPPCVCKEVAA